MRKILGKKGQSVLEFTAITVIILVAIMTMSSYFKRGVQGRWRTATDDIGDQYDPFIAVTNIRYGVTGTTNTSLMTTEDGAGFWTTREDRTSSQQIKRGKTQVGGARPPQP
ncbi:MAG: hypothetical protein NUV91_04880 [Candidatus Omnitrophica bacterium]|nr:hypothetical protein [Candidatus Omnitrophota bacterium]